MTTCLAALDASAYDAAPYASHPYAQTHPGRLAAVATLLGLAPAPVETARVLEIGCAAGGNLIPFAAYFPGATCVGIDLSGAQIAEGQARLASLGLANVNVQQLDVRDLDQADGEYDYIICHGVYSWAPHDAKAAILRAAHDNLAPNGVAHISYNVLPGWRLRAVARDMMLFHAGAIADPQAKVAAARAVLNAMAQQSSEASDYGRVLRSEARALALHGDHYIAHEQLERDNDPCTVSDMLCAARAAGLDYLADSDLHMTVAETFGPANAALLRDVSGGGLDRMEQYIDFLSGRTFRNSLFVRAAQAGAITRVIEPARLAKLYVSAALVESVDAAGRAVFTDAFGRTLTTSSDFARRALAHLSADFPRRYKSVALARAIAGKAWATTLEQADVLDALFKMVMNGMAAVSTAPLACGRAQDAAPRAHALVRADAAAGRVWTTGPMHETAPLTIVQRALLPFCDGAHDRAGLRAALARQVAAGDIIFQRDGAALHDPVEIAAALDDHLSAALAGLARAGLFAAG